MWSPELTEIEAEVVVVRPMKVSYSEKFRMNITVAVHYQKIE